LLDTVHFWENSVRAWTKKGIGQPQTDAPLGSFRTMRSSLMSSIGVRPEVTPDNMAQFGQNSNKLAPTSFNRDEVKNSPIVHAKMSDRLRLAEMIVAKIKT
jgi:hypothetical protein